MKVSYTNDKGQVHDEVWWMCHEAVHSTMPVKYSVWSSRVNNCKKSTLSVCLMIQLWYKHMVADGVKMQIFTEHCHCHINPENWPLKV